MAQCLPDRARACVLELRGDGKPTASASCAGEAWDKHLQFTLPDRFADGNGDGWWESVLRIDLDPAHGCSCLVVRATVELGPGDWAFDIGNSPTNNGHGGDEATTVYDAEIQLFQGKLVFKSSTVVRTPSAPHDDLSLDLTHLGGEARVEVTICDQVVRYEVTPEEGPPVRAQLSTRASQGGFAPGRVVPNGDATAGPPAHVIYAAFNRVIHDLRAMPDEGRWGEGTGRVEFYLEP